MFNSTSLVPSSIPLSGGAAIDFILTDIPLFCQGIMGMGVFTFLFIIKRVKLISVFLYGSSFLAFAAATLDLGQILARGSENPTREINLENITALLFAREIFLALSLSFLNIFFWMLVADCPIEESIPNATDRVSAISRQSMHSASWSRWGAIGTILKWCSLVALLSAPLLQALWRLIPSQRRYSTLYVAESTVQTSICLIFTLKLFLNIYLSTLPTWWDAFRHHIPSFVALAFGTSLGIGNLIIFSFSETSLGRFLRAVEVYILIIQSLHATFLADRRNHDHNTSSIHSPVVLFHGPEKSPNLLPTEVKSRYNSQVPKGLESSIFLYRQPQQTTLRVPAFPVPKPPVGLDIPVPSNRTSSQEQFNPYNTSPSPNARSSTQTYQKWDTKPSGSPPQSLVMDISYYLDPTAGDARANLEYVADNVPAMDRRNDSKPPSLTSFDEMLRQRNEMDRSIAVLQLQSQIFSGDNYSAMEDRARSTIGQASMTRTESISGRSEFSLSVFPDPPVVPSNEVATKYVVVDSPAHVDHRHSRSSSSTSEQAVTVAKDIDSNHDASQGEKLDSIGELDVTSFIGGSTESFYDQNRLSTIDISDTTSVDDRTTISAPTAVIGNTITLRPMILASALVLSPTERGALSAPSFPAYRRAIRHRSSSSGSDSPGSGLKPLFLGKPLSSIPPTKTGSLVPLAQRRQRGGTISNARRPLVISSPLIKEDASSNSNPTAFERPRPPPLRLT